MTRAATPRTDSATATAHMAGVALQALGAAGVDWALEARRCGVPETLEPEFRWRVPVASLTRLFERGCDLLGPGFPVIAARRPPDRHTSPLGIYCRTRTDGREALAALCEHWDLVTDGWWVGFDEEAGVGRLRWRTRGEPVLPALWWFDVADTVVSARGMASGLPELTVVTSLAPPPGLAALGVRVEQGEGHTLFLPEVVLSTRLPATDPSVRAFVERQIAALEAVRPAGSSIRNVIHRLGPTATLDAVADALGMSTRTLHRRLADAGTSFRRELDAVRADRARDLVETVPIDRAAEVLGYSDARALRRAVRRWRAA